MFNYISKTILLIISRSSILVGGQAIIEGVMMRVPGAFAAAVRQPDGKIVTMKENFVSYTEQHKLLQLPVFRGIIGLFEALKIGITTLNWSADLSLDNNSNNKSNKFVDFMLTLFSFSLALLLFFIAPISLSSWLSNNEQNPFLFNVLSGIIRIVFFLLYLFLISMMKDVSILFQYHGAEHKAVYTFEAGSPLIVENTRPFPTQHPRCGTSFLFLIMIVAIISFSILDSIIMTYVGELTLAIRLISHIPFIPVVAGLGY